MQSSPLNLKSIGRGGRLGEYQAMQVIGYIMPLFISLSILFLLVPIPNTPIIPAYHNTVQTTLAVFDNLFLPQARNFPTNTLTECMLFLRRG